MGSGSATCWGVESTVLECFNRRKGTCWTVQSLLARQGQRHACRHGRYPFAGLCRRADGHLPTRATEAARTTRVAATSLFMVLCGRGDLQQRRRVRALRLRIRSSTAVGAAGSGSQVSPTQ